jgi:hypothetical protein
VCKYKVPRGIAGLKRFKEGKEESNLFSYIQIKEIRNLVGNSDRKRTIDKPEHIPV